jgi:hypothetical protein
MNDDKNTHELLAAVNDAISNYYFATLDKVVRPYVSIRDADGSLIAPPSVYNAGNALVGAIINHTIKRNSTRVRHVWNAPGSLPKCYQLYREIIGALDSSMGVGNVNVTPSILEFPEGDNETVFVPHLTDKRLHHIVPATIHNAAFDLAEVVLRERLAA